jgi:hypothetical protein
MPNNETNPGRSGAMLAACRLYPRTSSKGAPYQIGRLGALRVLVLPKREGEAGDHSHVLMLAEAPLREADR